MASYLGVLTSVLAVATICGVALAGLSRGMVTNLREALADVRAQREDMEKDRDRWKADATQKQSDVDALTRVVTGEVHLVQLTQRLEDFSGKVDQHHAELRAHWRAERAVSEQMLDAIRNMEGRG